MWRTSLSPRLYFFHKLKQEREKKETHMPEDMGILDNYICDDIGEEDELLNYSGKK